MDAKIITILPKNSTDTDTRHKAARLKIEEIRSHNDRKFCELCGFIGALRQNITPRSLERQIVDDLIELMCTPGYETALQKINEEHSFVFEKTPCTITDLATWRANHA